MKIDRLADEPQHFVPRFPNRNTARKIGNMRSPAILPSFDNDHPFFKERVKKLEDEEHNPEDWKLACEKAMAWGDTIYTGLFFRKPDAQSLGEREKVLEQGPPLAHRNLRLTSEQAQKLIQRMM